MAENVNVPTKEELSQLPRMAIIAFATRCAQRVQTLFSLDWPNAPQYYVDAVNDAIAAADAHVAGRIIRGGYAVNAANMNAVNAVNAVNAAHAAMAVYAFQAAYVANAAANAAATAAADNANYETAATAADYAVGANPAVAAGIRHDYELLLERYRRENWGD